MISATGFRLKNGLRCIVCLGAVERSGIGIDDLDLGVTLHDYRTKVSRSIKSLDSHFCGSREERAERKILQHLASNWTASPCRMPDAALP